MITEPQEAKMPDTFHPTRRRLLAASAFAATGLSLGLEDAFAQQADPAMPRR